MNKSYHPHVSHFWTHSVRGISMYFVNTPYQPVLSTHPVNRPSQHPSLIHPLFILFTFFHVVHSSTPSSANCHHNGRWKSSTTPTRLECKHRSSQWKNLLFSFENRSFTMESPVLFHSGRRRKNESMCLDIFSRDNVSWGLSSL